MSNVDEKNYGFLLDPLNETKRAEVDGDHVWHREARVIRLILLNPSLLSQARDRLTLEHFTHDTCRVVWKAMVEMEDNGEEIEPVEVARYLAVRGRLESAGGWAEVRQLTDAFGTSPLFGHYIDRLVMEHRRRTLQLGLADASRTIDDYQASDVSAVIEQVRNQLDEASSAISSQADFRSFSDLATEQIVAVLDGKGAERIIPTGFSVLDREIGGLSPIYSVCAAYPGMGKTTLLVNLAINLSLAGRKVLYISLEDPKELLVERALSRLSGVSYGDIQRKRVRPEDHSDLLASETKVKGLPLIFENLAGANVARVRSLVLQYRERFGVPASIIVDHLGKIREKGSSLYERTSEASGKLADLQLELGCSLIAACQLARRKDKGAVILPKMDDLRDSGWLEADARQVWLLHRPQYFADQGVTMSEPCDRDECKLVSLKYPRPALVRLYADMAHAYIGDGPMGYNEQEGY